MPKKPSCKHWGSLLRVLASVFGRGNVWEAALPGDMDDGKNYLAAKSHGWLRSEACCSLSTRHIKIPPATQEIQESWVWSLGREDPLEEGHDNPLQCSCLRSPMDRRAWWVTVQRVSKSQTWLSNLAHTEGLSPPRDWLHNPSFVASSPFCLLHHAPVSISWESFPDKLSIPSVFSLLKFTHGLLYWFKLPEWALGTMKFAIIDPWSLMIR